ncbi:50S ribosomal protein L4P [Methanosalsum zhilinae DSM 4017]|uniref:Large ribosomal subunit protein uL4 n=1 Tax=Methanosalsum zhilinae (strain DSM 4017 / NBRC 107636 / OCM 62 / WeN5) TaxID=679901 RepID=F7XLU2_METZD|nr:50S ribosomal protein L4 [Methanosalsum zhilinae]AEH61082.1 50S ribosomal protein L4P [Methanosalsum zhilinae DSM 4017]
MTKTKVIDLSGNEKDNIELPEIFNEPYRPDLIKKAVLSLQSTRYQPYGPRLYSGMETSAHSWGSGRGVAQIPRISNGSRAARVPQAVGGRRAHPPKPEKDVTEKINKKEKRIAFRSAIAATMNYDIVKKRGHRFENEGLFVADDSLEELTRTKELVNYLNNVGVYSDVLRAKEGRKIRAGKGKGRGRKYRQRKSILIVTGSQAPLLKSARNLPGVDAVPVDSLNIEHLAPGTHAGRLTIWTESAISNLERGI